MTDTRRANARWKVVTTDNELWQPAQYDYMQLATLMDIRDELQALNSVFQCPNFLAIPHKLDRIVKNTTKPRRKRARKIKE
jgi:hypothetical protein